MLYGGPPSTGWSRSRAGQGSLGHSGSCEQLAIARVLRSTMALSNSSHSNCPKGKVVFASAPSAPSASLPNTCRLGRELGRRLSSPTALAEPERRRSEPGPGSLQTLLTVLTVCSRHLRILITLLPVRPSRLKAISMPSARRNVCARRKWPARTRGFLGQPVLSAV